MSRQTHCCLDEKQQSRLNGRRARGPWPASSVGRAPAAVSVARCRHRSETEPKWNPARPAFGRNPASAAACGRWARLVSNQRPLAREARGPITTRDVVVEMTAAGVLKPKPGFLFYQRVYGNATQAGFDAALEAMSSAMA